MDIRVLRMNTVKVKYSDIREFLQDLKRMKVRHRPFRRIDNFYEVDVYSDSKATLLKLKYAY
jgi:hypothetical protein